MQIKDKDRLHLRKMGEKYMIVHTSGQNVNMREVFAMNEPTAFLFGKALSSENFDENFLADCLIQEYEVDREQALHDVKLLIEEWRKYGLLESEATIPSMSAAPSTRAIKELSPQEKRSCQEAFLNLVQTALWEKDSCICDIPVLSESQWDEILIQSRKQTLSGLMFRSLDLEASKGANIPGRICSSLAIDADKYETHYRNMRAVTEKIFHELDSKGLHPVLLKGIAVATLYEQPELRACGDIDIWLPDSERKQAIPGDAKRSADGSYTFSYEGETIEIHDHILDIARPRSKKIAQKLIEKYGFTDVSGFRSTAGELTLLLLNAHILKHAVGRGIGLRQFCDYAVAHEKIISSNEALQCYEEDVRALGIHKWTRVLDCFCCRYLGMKSQKQFSTKELALSEKLLSKVMRGGNFGYGTRNGNGAFHTFMDFVRNGEFSLKVAAGETFWTVLSLLKGRLA